MAALPTGIAAILYADIAGAATTTGYNKSVFHFRGPSTPVKSA